MELMSLENSADFNESHYSKHNFLHTVLGTSTPIPYVDPDTVREFSTEDNQLSELASSTTTRPHAIFSVHQTAQDSVKSSVVKDKNYSCTFPGCVKSFARKYNLNVHTRTHYPELARPFKCSECAKAFGRKHDLRRHLATVHQTATLYCCSECSKPFARRDSLLKHEEKGCCSSPAR